jgi:hypothetical protein
MIPTAIPTPLLCRSIRSTRSDLIRSFEGACHGTGVPPCPKTLTGIAERIAPESNVLTI